MYKVRCLPKKPKPRITKHNLVNPVLGQDHACTGKAMQSTEDPATALGGGFLVMVHYGPFLNYSDWYAVQESQKFC